MLSILQEELKIAMKEKNKATLIGLRNIIGKLKAKIIDKGEELSEKECVQILQSSAKQLKESITQYKNGGRDDLAEVEIYELELIKKYLPKQLSQDDIRKIVQETIKSTGAQTIREMGNVMGNVMNQFAGAADGKIVQKIVQEELSL